MSSTKISAKRVSSKKQTSFISRTFRTKSPFSKSSWAVVAMAIVVAGAYTMLPKGNSFAEAPYAKVYLGAKIISPGLAPAAAGDAAAAGSAQLYPADTSRTITVQGRTAGSSGAWTTVKAATPAASGYIYFNGWSSMEYRAVVAAKGSSAQIVSPVQGYTLKTVFDDEFTGTTLNPAWAPRTINSPWATIDMRACTLTGNTLRVKAIADPAKAGHYLDCHIGTQNSFTFTNGWAAARIKFSKNYGSHSAFWLQSAPAYVDGVAEVDIAEQMGIPTHPASKVCDPATTGDPMNYHVYYNWTGKPVSPTSPLTDLAHSTCDTAEFGAASGMKWWNSYHVYSVRWLPNAYQFYIDGHKVGTETKGVATKPEFLALSMLTGTSEGVAMAKKDINTYQMDVDWVRVWQ